MSIEQAKLVIAVAAGASVGTGTFSQQPTGYLEEIYLDYGQTSAVTDVVITESGHSQAILTVSNNQTDGAYYPRVRACDNAATSFGSDGILPLALVSPLYVSVAEANVAAAAVTVYAKIRKI